MKKLSSICLVLALGCSFSFAQLNQPKITLGKDKTGASVGLSCNPGTGDTAFNFYRATGTCPAASYTRLGTSPMTTSCLYTDTTVAPATTYCYVATGLNSLGQESSYSNAAQAVIPGLPVVTAVTPITGAAAGGTPVTITGANFASGATVTFGGTAATSVVVTNSTSITAVTPAGTGTVTVMVTNPDGSNGSLASAFTYVLLPNPPTNLTVGTIVAGVVPLTWDAPAPQSGVTITSYNVLRGIKKQSLANIANTTGLSYSDGGCPSTCRYATRTVAKIDKKKVVSGNSNVVTAVVN